MIFTISKRNLIRIVSFSLAIVLAGAISLVAYSNQAKKSQLLLEYQYLKSIESLVDNLENIQNALTKANYTSTTSAMSLIGAKIWRESGFAKEALSNLPINYLQLENTYKFLSQVGDYSASLAKNDTISDTDRDNLVVLQEYCETFLAQILVVQDAVTTGQLSFDRINEGFSEVTQNSDVSNNLTEGFLEFEDGFTAYPTLIYDGPFSDHILQKEPEMLKNLPEISRENVREKIAQSLGIESQNLADDEDENSNMPSYTYTYDNINVSVTKNGGLLSYYIKDRSVPEENITPEEAIISAKEFLKSLDITEISETYYEISNNIITINFAGLQNDIICYTDLIKVSVAMDNSEVIRYDARGYITNNVSRASFVPSVSQAQAQAVLTARLDVQSSKLCVIPGNGLSELFCYEFTCLSQEGEKVLVYINAQNLKEEQILVLYTTENGTLAL